MLIQLILVLIFASFLVLSWKRYKEKVISLTEVLLWTALWLLGTVVVILPKLTDLLANFVGVGRGADLVMYLALAAMFYLIFKLFVNHEKMERKLTEMVRKDALAQIDKPPLPACNACSEAMAGRPKGVDQPKADLGESH